MSGIGRMAAAPIPKSIIAAGVLWIFFSVLTLLNLGTIFVRAQALARDPTMPLPFVIGFWLVALAFALGLCAFLYTAIQVLRGSARDTLGNGIASFVFGTMNLLPGVVRMIMASSSPSIQVGPVAAIADLIATMAFLVTGVGLATAGVLALLGRNAYRKWRRAEP